MIYDLNLFTAQRMNTTRPLIGKNLAACVIPFVYLYGVMQYKIKSITYTVINAINIFGMLLWFYVPIESFIRSFQAFVTI